MAPKKGFSVDLSEVGEALGVMEGILIETDRNIGDLAGYAARTTANRIGEVIDIAAVSGSNLSHMYEHEMVGNPRGRLFNIQVLSGGANSRVRTVTWTPRIAKVYGPSLQDRINSGQLEIDPSNKVFSPGSRSGNSVSLTKKYIFYQKASMIEFGKIANIKPRKSKLFIPVNNGSTGFVFGKQSRVNFAKSKNAGQFQLAWLHAQGLATGEAMQEINRLMDDSTTRTAYARVGKHTRKKSMTVAFEQSKEQTKREMRRYVNAEMRRNYSKDDGQ